MIQADEEILYIVFSDFSSTSKNSKNFFSLRIIAMKAQTVGEMYIKSWRQEVIIFMLILSIVKNDYSI